jgi:nitrogen regulatory protein PII
MKKIETFIQPVYWDQTHTALDKLGVAGALRQVKTFGRTPPRREVYRGSAYVLDTTNELELTLTVQDELLDATLAAIEEAAGGAEIIVTSVQCVGRAALTPDSQPRAVIGTVVPARPASYTDYAAAARA